MIERIRSMLVLVAFVALAACVGAPSGPARVTSVATEPGRGFVAVHWELAGTAERFELSRTEVGDGGPGATSLVRIEDGSVRSYYDVDVHPGVSYRYAVAVNGGEPVEDGSEGVRPKPGNQLQILFGSAVPEGVSVRSDPAGIDCATAGSPGCTGAFAAILDVELGVEATRDTNVTWEGCDDTAGGSCVVSMEDSRSVEVFVDSASHTLDVEVDAPGTGSVTNSNDLGASPVVDCADRCTYEYPDGLMIGLRADPTEPDDHQFASWGGACSDATTPSCTVTMDEATFVRAVFELIPPEIASFEADPERIWPHETSTLSWSVSGGGDVRLAIEPGVGDVTGRSEVEVSPDDTTVYTLTASNDRGSVTATTRVHVRLWPFGSLGSGVEVP